MTKIDKKSPSLQVGSNHRERIACLKAIVGKKFLQKNIQRRNLDKRWSKKCPAYVMVWFNIAFWFYGDDCYTQVFRWLHRFSKQLMPTSSALTQARAKIGVAIMAEVYRHIVQCLCTKDTPDAFYEGMRLVAVDGFVLNLPDSIENRRAFGRPKNGSSVGAFPQVRIVALSEVGSRVFFSFLAKPIRCGEATLAKHVYRDLPEKSILFFDMGFCAYELMMMVIDRKSDFLGRCKTNRCFKKMQVLSDGSYLSKIYATDFDRLQDRNGTFVRVIEYVIDDPQRVGHGVLHRLVTTLLDENKYPTKTLIVLYHERWEEEIGIDEAKTHLRKSPTLRSHRPGGVLQEVYGLLIAHFVIHKLAFEAAKKADISPRRISFTGTINVLRARLPEAPRSRHLIPAWHESLLEEISLQVLGNRRNRINPRVIKRPQSKWPKKREEHRKLPVLLRTFAETIELVT
jgi:Transposase DDE domain/Insertion element 4 transposase N-terminal